MFVVAGVSGHVGSVVADLLIAKGQKVRVIVRNASKGAPWSKRGADVAVGSLADSTFLTTTFKGADGAFLLLPPDFAAPDVLAAQRGIADALASAIKASGLKHVVFLSSVGADLESGTGPIKGLHYAEKVFRATGTVLTALRAGYFQENAGNVVGAAKQMGIFPNFMLSADVAMPMIATRDIGALAAESLLAKPTKNEVVDVHGPTYTVRQVGEKLGAALGKPLSIVDIPKDQWVDAMTKAGMPKPWAEAFAEMYSGFGSGAIKPKGDRMVQGKTPIDDVIKTVTR